MGDTSWEDKFDAVIRETEKNLAKVKVNIYMEVLIVHVQLFTASNIFHYFNTQRTKATCFMSDVPLVYYCIQNALALHEVRK